MKKLLRITFPFILLFAATLPACAQRQIIHKVSQGQTLYSISRIYGVSIEQLKAANPSLTENIKNGQQIVVPKAAETSYISHTIKAGETLYSISKTYGTTIDEIIAANPGITANNFRTDTIIRIPLSKSSNKTDSIGNKNSGTSFIAGSNCREMHRVKRKETFFSIARDYNMSVADLAKANPDIKAPDYKIRKGDFVCIPATDTSSSIKDNIGKKAANKPAPLRHVTISVVMPFNSDKRNELIIAREYYRGLLLAVNEMKKKGLSADVYAYSTTNSDKESERLLNSQILSNSDIIFGPYSNAQVNLVANIAQQKPMLFVVPFAYRGSAVSNTKNMFLTTNIAETFASDAASLINSKLGNPHIIVINSKDAKGNSLVEQLSAQAKNGVTHANVTSTAEQIAKQMDNKRLNLVVTDFADKERLAELLNKLSAVRHTNPHIKFALCGNESWLYYGAQTLRQLKAADTYVPTSIPRHDDKQSETDHYTKTYRHWFGRQTPQALLYISRHGYNQGKYFLNALQQHGVGFNAQKTTTDEFNFIRTSNSGGWLNRRVFLYHIH